MTHSFLNPVAARRQPSAIRDYHNKSVESPHLLSLVGGFPCPSAFPFEKISVTLKGGKTYTFEGEKLKNGLTYSSTNGIRELREQIQKLMSKYHGLQSENLCPNRGMYDLLVAPGAQDSLAKIFEATLNPGDPILCEEFSYTGMLAVATPYEPKYVPIIGDENGISPVALKETLENWNPLERKPKMIYLVPTGSNPTGTTIPENHRREIYQLCCEHDILIVEDDPYYFLELEHPTALPSFLSLDLDSSRPRVVRIESFSKIISAGLRVGWVTGPRAILKPVLYHQQASMQHVSTINQMMISELLRSWSSEGFERHIEQVQELYRTKRDRAVASAEKHLKDLCDWSVPSAGMFLWIRIKEGVTDARELMMDRACKAGMLMMPGNPFCTRTLAGEKNVPAPYLRAAYSNETPETIDKVFEILASVIREHHAQQLDKTQEIIRTNIGRGN